MQIRGDYMTATQNLLNCLRHSTHKTVLYGNTKRYQNKNGQSRLKLPCLLYMFQMDHSMRLHIAFGVEAFVTEVTGERFLAGVNAHQANCVHTTIMTSTMKFIP